jgi:hypothetical protein
MTKKSAQKLQKGQKGKTPYPNLAGSVSQQTVTSQTRGPKTFFLVVLAVPNMYQQDFMIGDFANIKYHLTLLGVQEEYWSTVD